MSTPRIVCLSALLAVVGAASCVQAQSGDAKAALEQKLKEAFPPTKFSADKSTVVTAGAVVVLEKDGLLMYTVGVPNPPRSTYKNGKLSQGFGDTMAVDMADGLGRQGGSASIPRKTLVTGEKFWVSDIAIAGNNIVIRVVTDPYDDGRYYADLKFPIQKNTIPPADEELRTIGEVLKLDSASTDTAQQGPPPVQPAPSATAPSAPPPPPPPPSDAPAPPPKTVSLGQTKDEVIASLGQPQKVVQLGAKEIDFYPDLKVTFVNGKVTDVQ